MLSVEYVRGPFSSFFEKGHACRRKVFRPFCLLFVGTHHIIIPPYLLLLLHASSTIMKCSHAKVDQIGRGFNFSQYDYS